MPRVVPETVAHLRDRSASVRERALAAWSAHARAQVRAQVQIQRVTERAAAEARALVEQGRIPRSALRVTIERIVRAAEVRIRAEVEAAFARRASTSRGLSPVVVASSDAQVSPLGGAAMIGDLPRSSPMTRAERRAFVRIRGQGEGTEVVAGRFDATTAAAMRNANRAALAFRASARLRARTDETVARIARTIEDGLRTRESAIGLVRKVASVDSSRITLAGYVEDVVVALETQSFEDPRERARILGAVRSAASRLGSGYDDERTIRGAVDRLVGAIERADVTATAEAVEGYIARRYRYEVGRIIRTEGMRAFARSAMDRIRSTPGVYAYEWRLSPSHPEPDICDVFARADLHGLGPGVYPVGNGPVAPAHPNCTCVMVPKITPESIRAARRGERMPRGKPKDRSWSDWLRKQPRDVQVAIAGVGGSDALIAGVDVVSPSGRVLALWELSGGAPPVRYAAGRPVDIERGQWSPVVLDPERIAADEAPKPTGPEAYGEIGWWKGTRSIVEGADLVIPEYVADEAGIAAALRSVRSGSTSSAPESIEFVFDTLPMTPDGHFQSVEFVLVDPDPSIPDIRVASARLASGVVYESGITRRPVRVVQSKVAGLAAFMNERGSEVDDVAVSMGLLSFMGLDRPVSSESPITRAEYILSTVGFDLSRNDTGPIDMSMYPFRLIPASVVGRPLGQRIHVIAEDEIGRQFAEALPNRGAEPSDGGRINVNELEAIVLEGATKWLSEHPKVRGFNPSSGVDVDEQSHSLAVLRSDPNIQAIVTKPFRGETMTGEEIRFLDAAVPRWRSVVFVVAKEIERIVQRGGRIRIAVTLSVPASVLDAAPSDGATKLLRLGPVLAMSDRQSPSDVETEVYGVDLPGLGIVALPGYMTEADGASDRRKPVARKFAPSVITRQVPMNYGPVVYTGEIVPVGGAVSHDFAEQRGTAARFVSRAVARGAVGDVGHVLDGMSAAEKEARSRWIDAWISNSDPETSAFARVLFGADRDELDRVARTAHKMRASGHPSSAVSATVSYVLKQYHATQALLGERGIGRSGSIRLYRGVDIEQSRALESRWKRIEDGGALTLPQRTLASWTTNYQVAAAFGSGGAVLYADVPIENVFAHWAVDHRLRGGKEQEVIVAVPPGAAFRVGVASSDTDRLRPYMSRANVGGAMTRASLGNLRVPAGASAAYTSALETSVSTRSALGPSSYRTLVSVAGLPLLFVDSANESPDLSPDSHLAASGVVRLSREDARSSGKPFATNRSESALHSIEGLVRMLGVPKEERGKAGFGFHVSLEPEHWIDAERTVSFLAAAAQETLALSDVGSRDDFAEVEAQNGDRRYLGYVHAESLAAVAQNGAYTMAVFPDRKMASGPSTGKDAASMFPITFGAGDLVHGLPFGGVLAVRNVATGDLVIDPKTNADGSVEFVMRSSDPVLAPSVEAMSARLRDEALLAALPPAPRDASAIREVAKLRASIDRDERLLRERPNMPGVGRTILERKVIKARETIESLAPKVRGHEREIEAAFEREAGTVSPMRAGAFVRLPFSSRLDVRVPDAAQSIALREAFDGNAGKLKPAGIRVVESLVRGSSYRPSTPNAPEVGPIGHPDSSIRIRSFEMMTRDEMEAMPSARAFQSGTAIRMRPAAFFDLEAWARKRAIEAEGGEPLGTRRAAVWDREVDVGEWSEWDAARTAVHEMVHASSPQSGSPSTYQGFGQVVEEVSTEVLTRAIMRRISGGPADPAAEPPESGGNGTTRYEPTPAHAWFLPARAVGDDGRTRLVNAGGTGSYDGWIAPLVDSVADSIFPRGDGVEAARRVERAAVVYRTLSGSDVVEAARSAPPSVYATVSGAMGEAWDSLDGNVRERIVGGAWAFVRGLGLDEGATVRVIEAWTERVNPRNP